MLGKVGILIVIFVLILLFYFVISWGSGKKRQAAMTKEFPSPEIVGYMRGVRLLIILIAIVSLILWLFL